jgi:hypothetical protein
MTLAKEIAPRAPSSRRLMVRIAFKLAAWARTAPAGADAVPQPRQSNSQNPEATFSSVAPLTGKTPVTGIPLPQTVDSSEVGRGGATRGPAALWT